MNASVPTGFLVETDQLETATRATSNHFEKHELFQLLVQLIREKERERERYKLYVLVQTLSIFIYNALFTLAII